MMWTCAGKRRTAPIAALAIAAAFACATPAGASESHHGGGAGLTFHVAPWGSDRSPGTLRRPFQTLQRAQLAVRASTARMRHDIVVEIHDGTYRLTTPLQLTDADGDSGENGHRVIYEPFRYGTPRAARPTISGGREIGGWRLDDPTNNVWRAEVGDLETRQLYVDGRRATRAAIDQDLPTFTRTDTGFVTTSDAPRSWSRPEDIELVFSKAFAWSEPRCGVASITGTTESTMITMDQPCFRRLVTVFGGSGFSGSGLKPSSIENSRSFLTRPGTFYLDRSRPGRHTLFYIPRPGEDLRSAHVVAPVLESLVSGAGTDAAPLHDVTFRGLTFADATWLQPNTDEGFVHYIAGQYENGDGAVVGVTLSPQAQSMPGNVAFRRADRIVIERNRFERLGAQALELVGSDSIVRGNVVTDVSGGGILVGDDHPETAGAVTRAVVVDDNWVHGIGVEYHGGTGIFATRTINLTVAHNQVDDVPYTGIIVGIGHPQAERANGPQDPNAPANVGARIVANNVFDVMKVLSDGGGIYTNLKEGTSWETGARIEGNVVHDMQQLYWGIYTDWGSGWEQVDDNVVYDTVFHSAGGCSMVALGGQIAHMRYSGNYFTEPAPVWLCGPVDDVTVTGTTVLPNDAADGAAVCSADARCADIVRHAGIEPAYRDLLPR